MPMLVKVSSLGFYFVLYHPFIRPYYLDQSFGKLKQALVLIDISSPLSKHQFIASNIGSIFCFFQDDIENLTSYIMAGGT